jgi:hypothetical protein
MANHVLAGADDSEELLMEDDVDSGKGYRTAAAVVQEFDRREVQVVKRVNEGEEEDFGEGPLISCATTTGGIKVHRCLDV